MQHVRERRVQVVLAEVVPAERAAELGQRAVEVVVGELEFAFDRPGVGVGVADDHADAGQDDDLVRVPALRQRPALDVGVEGLTLFDGRGVGEDALADGRAQVPPLVGVTGLEDHRLALLGPGDIERPGHLEVLAPVVKRVLPGRVEEHSGWPVPGNASSS